MNEGRIKKITIIALIFCILVMSFAYANLFEQLIINGNASVIASWKVEITGIKEGNKTIGASSVSIPSFTPMSANFDVVLTNEDDSIEYFVTIKNSGDIDAKLDSITTTKIGSNAIIYEITGVNKGDIIKKGESVVVTIKVSIDPNVGINEPNLSTGMKIDFNYSQSV